MSPYMSAYVAQALTPQLQAQQEQFNDQNKGVDSAATMAGAFGDTGWGQLRGKTTQSQDAARSGLIGNAYNAAFNTAIGAGAQDTANDINAQTTNAKLRETALGRQLGGANAAFNMGTGATNLTNSLGGQQTAQQQAQLNAQYNEFLRNQYQDPQFRAGLSNAALGAATPAAPTTTTKTAPDNSGYGLIGAGLGAAGYALGGPLGGMAGSAIGSMFGSGGQGQGDSSSGDGSEYYADGGRPPVGKPVMVGERGPEMFVPDQHSGGMPMGHMGQFGQPRQPGQPGQFQGHNADFNRLASLGGGWGGLINMLRGGQSGAHGFPGALPPGFGLMGGTGAMPAPAANGGQPSNLSNMAQLLGGGQAAGQLLSRTNPSALPATTSPGQPSNLSGMAGQLGGFAGSNVGATGVSNNGMAPASPPAPTSSFGGMGVGSATPGATPGMMGANNAMPATTSPGQPGSTPHIGAATTSKMPGFERGGRPPVGKPVVVGEHGPEVVVMDKPGTVVPNEVLAAARDKKRTGKRPAQGGGLAAQLGAAA